MPKRILLIQFVVTSLVLIAISVPLIYGWVRPNRWYGFRTPRTLADPQIWYPINSLVGKRLAAAAFTILVGAVAFYFVPRWELLHYAIANLAVTVLSLGFAIVQSTMDLQKLPANKPDEDKLVAAADEQAEDEQAEDEEPEIEKSDDDPPA